jgi:hypothetical protein
MRGISEYLWPIRQPLLSEQTDGAYHSGNSADSERPARKSDEEDFIARSVIGGEKGERFAYCVPKSFSYSACKPTLATPTRKDRGGTLTHHYSIHNATLTSYTFMVVYNLSYTISRLGLDGPRNPCHITRNCKLAIEHAIIAVEPRAYEFFISTSNSDTSRTRI